jgi:PPOX class probable F420-dependent enzyme
MSNGLAAGPPDAAIPPNVRSFLTATPRYAALATVNPDGSPHQAVIWYLVRGDTIVINSREGRRWPANLRRDPRVSFAVEGGDDAVTIDALAEVLHDPAAARDDIAEMAVFYDPPDVAREEIARFRTEQRVTFVLHPQRIHTHGDPG